MILTPQGKNLKSLDFSIPMSSNGLSLQNNSQVLNQSIGQNRSTQQIFQILGEAESLTQSNRNTSNKLLSDHLNNLRRSNLISILSSKQFSERNDRQTKLIMEILKFQPFFEPIANNYKFLSEISSKLQYKFFKEGQTIYRINQFTQGYFILIRGSVQLSIPQKIINNTKIKLESENAKLLRQIEQKHKKRDAQKKGIKKQTKTHNENKREKQKFDTQQKPKEKKEKQNLKKEKQVVEKVQKSQESLQQNKILNQQRQQQISVHQTSSFANSPPLKPQQIFKVNNPRILKGKLQSKISFSQSIHSDHTQRQNSDSKQKQKGYPAGKNSREKKQLIKTRSNKKNNLDMFWSPTQFKFQDQDQELFNEDQFQLAQNQYQNLSSKPTKQSQQIVQAYADKIVKIVEEGECFGEITVGQINKRATNAKAKYDCHLILIRKQHYDLISKASLSTQMKRRHEFLLCLELFKKIYRYSIQGFLYYMNEIPTQYKSLLYKEGEQIKYIYIIKNGQFSLSKSINSNYTKQKTEKNQKQTSVDSYSSLRRQLSNWRSAIFKAIFSGQILGDCQALLKKETYGQTCKCQSQTGIVYQIEKSVFIEKLLAPQNQLNSIKRYLSLKYKNKTRYLEIFLEKHLNNQIISRMLPPSRSCDGKIKRKISFERINSSLDHTKKEKDLEQNNFFTQFNRTVYNNKEKKRLSCRYAVNISEINSKEQKIEKNRCKTSFDQHIINQTKRKNRLADRTIQKQIPSCIKDVVSIVSCKQKYFKTRNKNQQSKMAEMKFQFQKHKLPKFIEQKYKYLLKRIQKK